MAKSKILFVCGKCGGEHLRWQGQCQFCGEWNSLKEVGSREMGARGQREKKKAVKLSELKKDQRERVASGVGEFDRVLGGGFISGGVVLLAGAPGVGKSTLLLQVAGKLGKKETVVYVSGEESDSQIIERANRLGIVSDNLYFLAQTDIDLALSELADTEPSFAIFDSAQTFTTDDLDAGAGSPSQVKEVAARINQFAKTQGIPAILTGHVTKSYAIGGPKTLEHMVDVVLFFEGERYSQFRVLRAVKNRFGSTGEVGVFEMKKKGLEEVDDPSAAFLSGRSSSPGSALTVALEGSRPLVLEIQALTAPSSFRNPRRTTQGVAGKRALLIVAALEKYGGLKLGRSDIFIKGSYGLRVFEPAADLAIALAIASSALKKPVPKEICAFGEVGLNGEIRSVVGEEERRKHIKKMGLEPLGAKDYSTVRELLGALFSKSEILNPKFDAPPERGYSRSAG